MTQPRERDAARQRGGPLPVMTTRDGRTFGQTVRGVRKGQHMTMNDVAAASGLSKATISTIENDAVDPQLTTFLRLAKALRVPVTDLLGGFKTCTCDPALGQGCSDCPPEMFGPTECTNCGHRWVEHPGCCSCNDFQAPGDDA